MDHSRAVFHNKEMLVHVGAERNCLTFMAGVVNVKVSEGKGLK